jgi:hypothetical protein
MKVPLGENFLIKEGNMDDKKGSGNSADLRELEALVKRVEMLKNKMRDLFERARETKPRD